MPMENLLPKQKVKELVKALERRCTEPVIIYGPPRCGKSTLIAYVIRLLGLSPVDVDNVRTFNPKYLRRDEVGIVDQDTHEEYPANVIVETRRFIRGASVKMNPISKTRIRESTNEYDAALVAVQGRAFSVTTDIFHKLGKLFYKSESIETEMIREYVHGNYLEFMELDEAQNVADALSAGVSDDVLVQCVRTRTKTKPRGFYSFRPSKML